MNLRSPGPVARRTITVKAKCRVPLSEPFQGSVRGSLVDFKTFRVVVAMLQHRHFQNIKIDGNKFIVFYEKECNILINPL